MTNKRRRLILALTSIGGLSTYSAVALSVALSQITKKVTVKTQLQNNINTVKEFIFPFSGTENTTIETYRAFHINKKGTLIEQLETMLGRRIPVPSGVSFELIEKKPDPKIGEIELRILVSIGQGQSLARKEHAIKLNVTEVLIENERNANETLIDRLLFAISGTYNVTLINYQKFHTATSGSLIEQLEELLGRTLNAPAGINMQMVDPKPTPTIGEIKLKVLASIGSGPTLCTKEQEMTLTVTNRLEEEVKEEIDNHNAALQYFVFPLIGSYNVTLDNYKSFYAATQVANSVFIAQLEKLLDLSITLPKGITFQLKSAPVPNIGTLKLDVTVSIGKDATLVARDFQISLNVTEILEEVERETNETIIDRLLFDLSGTHNVTMADYSAFHTATTGTLLEQITTLIRRPLNVPTGLVVTLVDESKPNPALGEIKMTVSTSLGTGASLCTKEHTIVFNVTDKLEEEVKGEIDRNNTALQYFAFPIIGKHNVTLSDYQAFHGARGKFIDQLQNLLGTTITLPPDITFELKNPKPAAQIGPINLDVTVAIGKDKTLIAKDFTISLNVTAVLEEIDRNTNERSVDRLIFILGGKHNVSITAYQNFHTATTGTLLQQLETLLGQPFDVPNGLSLTLIGTKPTPAIGELKLIVSASIGTAGTECTKEQTITLNVTERLEEEIKEETKDNQTALEYFVFPIIGNYNVTIADYDAFHKSTTGTFLAQIETLLGTIITLPPRITFSQKGIKPAPALGKIKLDVTVAIGLGPTLITRDFAINLTVTEVLLETERNTNETTIDRLLFVMSGKHNVTLAAYQKFQAATTGSLVAQLEAMFDRSLDAPNGLTLTMVGQKPAAITGEITLRVLASLGKDETLCTKEQTITLNVTEVLINEVEKEIEQNNTVLKYFVFPLMNNYNVTMTAYQAFHTTFTGTFLSQVEALLGTTITLPQDVSFALKGSSKPAPALGKVKLDVVVSIGTGATLVTKDFAINLTITSVLLETERNNNETLLDRWLFSLDTKHNVTLANYQKFHIATTPSILVQLEQLIGRSLKAPTGLTLALIDPKPTPALGEILLKVSASLGTGPTLSTKEQILKLDVTDRLLTEVEKERLELQTNQVFLSSFIFPITGTQSVIQSAYQAYFDGTTPGTFKEQLEELLLTKITLPPGTTLEISGPKQAVQIGARAVKVLLKFGKTAGTTAQREYTINLNVRKVNAALMTEILNRARTLDEFSVIHTAYAKDHLALPMQINKIAGTLTAINSGKITELLKIWSLDKEYAWLRAGDGIVTSLSSWSRNNVIDTSGAEMTDYLWDQVAAYNAAPDLAAKNAAHANLTSLYSFNVKFTVTDGTTITDSLESLKYLIDLEVTANRIRDRFYFPIDAALVYGVSFSEVTNLTLFTKFDTEAKQSLADGVPWTFEQFVLKIGDYAIKSDFQSAAGVKTHLRSIMAPIPGAAAVLSAFSAGISGPGTIRPYRMNFEFSYRGFKVRFQLSGAVHM